MVISAAVVIEARAVVFATGVLERVGVRDAGCSGSPKRLIRVFCLDCSGGIGQSQCRAESVRENVAGGKTRYAVD